MALPQPLPDNPLKWEGWRLYNSPNFYERLGLDFFDNPSAEQIEENCRQLLIWWQKKLPLKNQPSNPLAQLLRAGIDEAPQCIANARAALLDPCQRAEIDARLRTSFRERALAEVEKFLTFAVADGSLDPDNEANLIRIGTSNGLTADEIRAYIDAEITKRGVVRRNKPPPDPPRAVAAPVPAGDPVAEFRRLLRLSGLEDGEMTDDQRDALCNMGENLGLTGGQAEDLIDEYLDEMAGLPPLPAAKPIVVPARPTKTAPAPLPAARAAPQQTCMTYSPLAREQERQAHPDFSNSIGMEMRFIPSGQFHMGSTLAGAAPNEQPVARVGVSGFYIARFPVTNAQYELFDPSHKARRPAWADDRHPVVYVSSRDAMQFCEWLSKRERRKYRLPTEAEWEYAARGTDGRVYPWGQNLRGGDLANFADANTAFPWRDPEINDGFAQTSPVGSFPRGASPFGIEDMAGNVWEWCLDFYAPYPGRERINPRGPSTGTRRVYRGGSWKSRRTTLRTTARGFNELNFSADDVGFRIVCECG